MERLLSIRHSEDEDFPIVLGIGEDLLEHINFNFLAKLGSEFEKWLGSMLRTVWVPS